MKTKRSDEVINSVGRVLGDHTVLYKYLNPNLVAFMTMQGDGVKRSIFVYIVDAVTGITKISIIIAVFCSKWLPHSFISDPFLAVYFNYFVLAGTKCMKYRFRKLCTTGENLSTTHRITSIISIPVFFSKWMPYC